MFFSPSQCPRGAISHTKRFELVRAKIAGRIHDHLNLSLLAIQSDLDAGIFRSKSFPMMKGAGQFARPAAIA